ncbi:MAG: class I SAM-dependent methyltransferase [Cyclobacteriaceae bacterium]|jgi:2-polyprenyl-3-methyl-5-hydroxy-6-metoxy-1,4-benzoquinol methylase|nr:class I SAM-dependent methyltransferase [Cyclobacteriaceae bacterium]
MKEDLQKRVDESSAFYANSFLSLDYKLADYAYDTLKQFFTGTDALEIGPASGYMTKHLINDFKSLDVLEGSETLLKAIPPYNNVRKFHSLIENFESDKEYDTIIMSHVLEHIEEPIKNLGRIKSWLKEKGRLLIAVPNALSLHRMAAVEMGLLKNEYQLNERDLQLGHFRVYDLETLSTHLREAGFKITNKGGYFLKPLSNNQIEKNWDDKMIHAFYLLGNKFPTHCAEIYIVAEK